MNSKNSRSFYFFFLVSLLTLSFFWSCVPGEGTLEVEDIIPTIKPKITSLSVASEVLTINGTDLLTVTGLKISDGTTDYDFNILTKAATQITAASTAAISLGMNAAYNLVLTSAFGQQTFPITLNPNNASVGLAQLADMGAADGDVLKWNSSSSQWYTAPDVGAGVGGGTVTSVGSGTGLTGGPVTVSGILAVDVGTTANKIPQFDGSGILPLGAELRMTQSSNTASIYTDGASAIFFKDVTGATVLGSFNNSGDLSVTGDLAVSGTSATVNGKNICLADGTDCPAGNAGTVTSITAGAGLSGGTITTSGTIAVASSGITSTHISNGTIVAADLNAMGATANQVLTYNGSAWAPATPTVGTVTSVTGGTGLTGGTITSSGTLAVDVGTTANKIPQLDSGGKLVVGILPTGIDAANISAGSVSNTEFDYLNGTTSTIQTQIDSKVAKSGDTITGNLILNANVGIGVSSPSVRHEEACPAGFTNVKSGNNQLGCIQTAEHGVGTYRGGMETCFTNYGGRLPTAQEWYLAMNYYSLTDETDDWELTGDLKDNNNIYTVGDGSITAIGHNSNTTSSTHDYRCWIPR